MVSKKQLEKHSDFLKELKSIAGNGKLIKRKIKGAATSCLKVLVLLVKDCLYAKIPLTDLTPDEKKKLARYKSMLRNILSLNSKLSR